ncbi:hypothetical protein [Synechococcus sp. GFB01]|uniref:hypothetical protein n=1 Tax=Synechococcus sp. GFB01 TaxID=1662190 RepID=UPI001F3AADF2|nr:hypothetical protein [Synechococcus sp. GFB01]
MSQTIEVWGLGFSPQAEVPLRQLQQARVIDALVLPGAEPSAPAVLADAWPTARAFVVVGACGLITRLIAPLLAHKDTDPAVVVIDPAGRFAIPLLGGHRGGAEQLSQEVAALLGGQAVLTGSSGASGRLALDSFGRRLGLAPRRRRRLECPDAAGRSAGRSDPGGPERRQPTLAGASRRRGRGGRTSRSGRPADQRPQRARLPLASPLPVARHGLRTRHQPEPAGAPRGCPARQRRTGPRSRGRPGQHRSQGR